MEISIGNIEIKTEFLPLATASLGVEEEEEGGKVFPNSVDVDANILHCSIQENLMKEEDPPNCGDDLATFDDKSTFRFASPTSIARKPSPQSWAINMPYSREEEDNEFQKETDETEGIVNESEVQVERMVTVKFENSDGHGQPLLDTLGKCESGKKKVPKLRKINTAICAICSTGFPSPDLYEDHMRKVHMDKRPYPCGHCGKPFATPGEKKKHETIHDSSRFQGEPKFSCDICGKRYHIKGSLQIHRKVTHFGYKRPTKNYNRVPVVVHHSTRGVKNPNPYRKPKQVFPCPHCDLKFDMKCNLQKHMISHSDDKPFPCPICKQPFKDRKRVRQHVNDVHHKSTPSGMHHPRPKWQAGQPCPCELCPKVFKVPSQLRRHMTLHTGEKPYECPTCGERFRMREGMKTHIKRVHSLELRSNPLKLYKCIICGKNDFVHFSDLRRHRTNTHKHIPYESKKEKPFGCVICGKPWFLREDAIICAELRHDPDSLFKQMFKFKCPQCPPPENFAFRTLSLLRKHWQAEHSDKFLPVELRRGINLKAVKDDVLPSCSVDKRKVQSWKMNGFPEEILSQDPTCLEFPLLPISEDERRPPQRRGGPGRKRKWVNPMASVLKCNICGLEVSKRDNLLRHLSLLHDSSRPHGCSICNQRFLTKISLQGHNTVYHAQGNQVPRKARRRTLKGQSKTSSSEDDFKWDDVVMKTEPVAAESTNDIDGGIYIPEQVPVSTIFKCRFCSRKFSKIRAARIHELRAHLKSWSTHKQNEVDASTGTPTISKNGMNENDKNKMSCQDVLSGLRTTVNINDKMAVASLLGSRNVQVQLSKLNGEKNNYFVYSNKWGGHEKKEEELEIEKKLFSPGFPQGSVNINDKKAVAALLSHRNVQIQAKKINY